MIKKSVLVEIDRAIKEIWNHQIKKDYQNDFIFKEDSLKCCIYYHLRKKLSRLLQDNNLRIFTEFHIQPLNKFADLAIVGMDYENEYRYFHEYISDVVAIIELKLTDGTDTNTVEWVKNDIRKMKQYLQEGEIDCQYYFACIYEEECDWLQWMDKRSTNNWASGRVTELNAGFIDGEIAFEVHSYNGMNKDLNDYFSTQKHRPFER